jgi:tetratricopeptide (TPR) repeat protein
MASSSRWVLLLLIGLLLPAAQSSGEMYYQQGLRLMQQGYYQEARLYLEQAREQDPHNPELLFSLGIVLYKQKDYQNAYLIYQEALKDVPSRELKGRIQGALADIYFQLEDFEQAANAYKQAVYLLPQVKGLRLRLALSFLRLQNYAFALVETEKLLKEHPLLEEAYQLRSLIKLSQTNYSQALQDFEKALEQKKQPDFESWVQLNWLYRINSDFSRAQAIAQKLVMAYAKSHPEAYLIAGDTAFESLTRCPSKSACRQTEQAQQAINYYEKYTLVEPQQALGQFKLGRLYLWSKSPQSAHTFFRRAEMLFPEHRPYAISSIESEMASGKWLQARKKIDQNGLNADLLEDLELLIKLQDAGKWPELVNIKDSEPLAEFSPSQKSLWFFLKGYFKYQQTHQLQIAQADWLQAEKLDPQGPGNDLIRALRMQNAKQTRWAQDLFKQATRKHPEWWLPYQLMGQLLLETEEWENASDYFEQAIRWNPLSKSSFLGLLETEAHLNQDHQETLNYALSIYPDAPELQAIYWQELKQETSL